MKLTNTNDIRFDKIKALLYGFSGSGKTYSARTLPRDKTLVISAEKGLLSIAKTGMDKIEIASWDELIELYFELGAWDRGENFYIIDGNKTDCEFIKKKYDFIFIDSLTEINEMCKDKILSSYPKKKETMEIQDWGKLYNKMSKMIKGFRDLESYGVIMIAGEEHLENKKTGELTLVPSLNGKLRTTIMHFFDFVFKAVKITDEKKDEQYFFLTEETDRGLAKSRGGALDVKEIPNWLNVISKIDKMYGGKK